MNSSLQTPLHSPDLRGRAPPSGNACAPWDEVVATNARSIALIADSQELFRAGLAIMLKRDLGFDDVIEAGSLDEALVHLANSSGISLASFDLALPGIKTMASLQAVREAFPQVRMAVVSATTERDDILQTLAAGVHGFIPKTLPVAEAARSFQLVLDGHIYVPSCLANSLSHALPRPPSIERRRSMTPQFASLTLRQQAVLDLIRQGKSNKQIARALNLAVGTIKIHVNGLFRTLGVHNRVDAITALPVSSINGTRHPTL